jgi:hypothetical protein
VNRRAAHLGGSMPMAGLVRASAHARRIGTETGFLHTTTIERGGGPSMQSVVANNDLDEMLSLADLAGKDYTAERQNITVVVYVAFCPAVGPPRATRSHARRDAVGWRRRHRRTRHAMRVRA